MRIHRGVLAPILLVLATCCVVQAQYLHTRQLCGADDFRCNNGKCIERGRRCNRIVDCPTQEDEQDCDCREDEFRCVSDGSCIEGRRRCDNVNNCPDSSDEQDCGAPSLRCPPESFMCDAGSSRPCATRCDGRTECDDGEDEDNCDECNHQCDGKCLKDHYICDGNQDCLDGSDELRCDNCDGPNDFRCRSGECINKAQHCNGLYECSDASDEENCNDTMIPVRSCTDGLFQCRNGECINSQFHCDGSWDCTDNSDEDNCPCDIDSWQCSSGQCINIYEHCDGTSNCNDGSDELDCPTPRPWTTAYPPYRPPYVAQTTQPPVFTTTSKVDVHIRPVTNPPTSGNHRESISPVALKLRTYPDNQTVRNAKYSGGDVVFQCRDEGPQRVPVRWIREDGRPLKPGSTDRNGRLEMNKVSVPDSGVYICQAPRYLGYPGSELKVVLTVEAPVATYRPPFIACEPYQAVCGNGQCIARSAICDGNLDCADGSDEDACNRNGMCEPNEYQCNNRKCVLKTWLCDSEDDCGDNSDETNCGPPDPRQFCLPVEFKCGSGKQCIPKSFHCDGQSDCGDGSDEIGCAPVHVTKPPAPSNVRLSPGETLILVCEAVGVPIPFISWRRNWGHVPPKCHSISVNGVGTLTCPDMQPEDSGAYSCEAINNKGTTFATPDAIVYVIKTGVCPNGFFNSEARSEADCIPCFCFGESTQCRSADLFTYDMPTPLGEGGTRLVGVKQAYNGEAQLDSQPITDQYYYQPLRNGATITKLANYGSDWSYGSTAHPYLTLPETYNANQLTSYGGRIKYRLSPHSPRYGSGDNLPSIIIKGKYESLVHHHRSDNSRDSYIEARMTPENWQKSSPRGLVQATREDIMMALDNIEMILLRADWNNAGVNITDFAMESAQHINVGLGAANLVEECTCPPGYEGLSCQKCASGFVREKSGPWLGNCVREQKPCPPGYYGDPNSGSGCKPCPCPLTNPSNQFARTCSLGSNGDIICDCSPGYGGRTCEYCDVGFIGNPMVPGDYCKPQPISKCNQIGTLRTSLPDDCICKDQVVGRYCDQCKNDSFFLSEDFRHGCALCFCSGVSQECRSSNLRRKTTAVRFNTPQIVDQVKIYSSAPLGPAGAVKYNAPVETELRPQLVRNEVALPDVERSRPMIYYWSLPASFAGDKVTAYGGFLRYTLRYIPLDGYHSSWNNAADIQLISENRLTFHYFGNFVPSNDGTLNASIQFLEKGWHRSDGKDISREHFLLALADVRTILVKATYAPNTQVASIESASIETAEPNGDGPSARHVEQCVCPTGYIGTSCEDCAPGYTRSSSGLYLEHCEPCNCNGHSNMCHPETGQCFTCGDNSDGENCELCRPGYEKNSYGICVSPYATTESPQCNCDARGITVSCETTGYCSCKQNVQGDYCDRCIRGTFGLDSSNPHGCLPCYCSGLTSDCNEATHFSRIAMAAPIFGDNYGGYILTDINAESVINDEFVPAPNESELMYIFNFPPTGELYWSLPEFPGNRVTSYGGALTLKQSFKSLYSEVSQSGIDVVLIGDSISIYWSNPTAIRSEEPLSYQVPLREDNWFLLNTATPASRNDFMAVLKNLRRVLVRATLVPNIAHTAIADVSMDTATDLYDPSSPAKGVEICICPEGYSGTSCEQCSQGYYRDQYDHCSQCNCNGNDCQLDRNNRVICHCRPPYTGVDCSIVGGDSFTNVTTRPPPSPESSVTIRIRSPTIKIQEVGKSVTFTCVATSRITSQSIPITWVKEGGYLPQGRSDIDQRNGVLLLTNLQRSDSGVYICQTADGYSTDQARATLKVPGNDMTIPTVTIEPAVNEYYEGQTIQLECITTGTPTPRVTWQRSANRALPLTSESYEAMLIIRNAREEDAGEYRCIASNAAGSTDRTAIVTVRPSWSPRDKLSVSPTASTISEGQSTRLVCTGTTNVPSGSIDWIRQDGDIFLSNVRSDNGVLYIESARPENQGIYICQSTSSSATPVPVLVTVIPLGTPSPSEASNITVSVTRLKIPTGGTGSVDCDPTGYPLPLIRWSKYQGQFGPGTSQRDNTLIINNAQEDDQGYYFCAGSVDGTPISNIYVFVEIEKRAPPRVEIWPQGEQAVALGSQFELHCRVLEGDPEPDVLWNRNGGRRLSTFAHIQPHNVLKFEKIEVNDEGEYTCSATNLAGTHSASAVIKVRSPPEISITPRNYVQVVAGDPVNVECRARGYPEPLVSIRTSTDQREIVSPAPGIAALRINSVSDRDEGSYICTATSPAGTIEDQFAIRVERGDGGFIGGGSGEGEIITAIPEGGDSGEPGSLGEEILVNINQPRQQYRVGDNVEVLCRAQARGIDVGWEKYSNNQQRQYVETRKYGDGSMLLIRGIMQSDAGVYRCTGRDPYGRTSYEDFDLEIQPVSIGPAYPINEQNTVYTANLGQVVDLPCNHNLEQPAKIEWRREYTPLPAEMNPNVQNLHLDPVTEADAGTYVCRVSNDRADIETRAILRVVGVVPQFEGESWLSLPTLKDAYMQFDIEISFKPRDGNGLILYNSQNEGRTGKYVALQLIDNVPQFVLDTGTGPVIVNGDRPLQLNIWHTIRISRTNTQVTMDVDNTGPFVTEPTEQRGILELYKPLYIGGVPDYDQLPSQLAGASGFMGCVSMLILGREEKNIMVDSIDRHDVKSCDSCAPNLCLNNGVCQEARNERGFMCLCATGFAGLNCDRPGEACRPGLCGPGKCTNTVDGYKCACPVTYTGRNCENKQSIEYPAFTGSAYLAINAPKSFRFFRMSMKVNPTSPVSDGIIMYCAESARGFGGFISLAVHDGKLELRYYSGYGSDVPVVLTANRTLPANEWTDVIISRLGSAVYLKINTVHVYEQKLVVPRKDLRLDTPMFVGGVDDSITLNNYTGVTGGFSGCIKEVMVQQDHVDIVNSSIQSANVQECSNFHRGDIPENETLCSLCRNGGYCTSSESTECLCPPGYTGTYCEVRVPQQSWRLPTNPCSAQPCQNGGTCKADRSSSMNYSCDCPLRYAGANCQMTLELQQSVGFNGTGYLELPSQLLQYNNRQTEPVLIALRFYTTKDGVLFYQREALTDATYGDYILLRVDRGRVALEWDLGGGLSSLILNDIFVNDGERHDVIVKINFDNSVSLTVDRDFYTNGYTNDLSNHMHAETRIYIGGMPEPFNVQHYPGFSGCLEQVELMDSSRGLNLGHVAVTGRNTQRCRDPRSYL